MEKNNKILILIGIPASGKSTWASDFVSRNDGFIRVSRDDFRYMLKNSGVCEPKIESMVTDLVNESITHALLRKLNVILDNTNLKESHIDDIVNKFKYSADIDYRVFDISLEKALDRDEKRDKKVGKLAITKMFKDYKILMDSFGFEPIKKQKREHLTPKFNTGKKDAVIFDIDGTIALMNNRGPFDWDKVYKDDLNQVVSEHIDFHKSKDRSIILVTGRDKSCEKITKEWLELYNIEYDHLYMRPKNDYRKDTIVKREIYNDLLKAEYNVVAAYDDRLSVLEMWFNEGIFTFNINQGNFKF